MKGKNETWGEYQKRLDREINKKDFEISWPKVFAFFIYAPLLIYLIFKLFLWLDQSIGLFWIGHGVLFLYWIAIPFFTNSNARTGMVFGALLIWLGLG